MDDLDKLNELSRYISEIAERYKPYNAVDINIRLHNALTLAQDQIEYAAHLLHKRVPDDRQQSFEMVGNRTAAVMITSEICEGCGNPMASCTCPK